MNTNEHDYAAMKASRDEARTALTHATAEVERLTKERDNLAEWKRQMLLVESEWDLQELAKSFGATLGQSCRKAVLKGITTLRAANAELLKERDETITTYTRLCVERNHANDELSQLKTVAFQAQEAAKELLGKLTVVEGERDEANRVAEGYLANAVPTGCAACAEHICCGSHAAHIPHVNCIYAKYEELTAAQQSAAEDKADLDWLEEHVKAHRPLVLHAFAPSEQPDWSYHIADQFAVYPSRKDLRSVIRAARANTL